MRRPHEQPVASSVDDARLRPHLRERSRLEARDDLERRQADALRDARAGAKAEGRETPFPSPTSVATAAGDPRKLRGIPAIGRSVGGAIGGTQPEQETVRRSERAA